MYEKCSGQNNGKSNLTNSVQTKFNKGSCFKKLPPEWQRQNIYYFNKNVGSNRNNNNYTIINPHRVRRV